MPATATLTRDETQIRERIDKTAQAIRAKDINAVMANYAPDVVVFDLMPLQTLGRDAYQKNFEGWFDSVQGSIEFAIRDLRITVSDSVALCFYVARVKNTGRRERRPTIRCG